jgi:hypothetical protein
MAATELFGGLASQVNLGMLIHHERRHLRR